MEPKLKTIVILRYFEALKLEEIAQAPGANLNTEKARLYRALKKMRDVYKRQTVDCPGKIPVVGAVLNGYNTAGRYLSRAWVAFADIHNMPDDLLVGRCV